MTTITEQDAVQTRLQEADGAGAGNLEKVRDLLFGGQMRDYDRKFARLEERLSKETAELRDEVRKRLAAFEAYVKAEIESLSDRLRAEQDARAGAAKDLARELRDTSQHFEQKTSQIDDLVARTHRELRQQLHAQHQELGDDIRQRVEDVLSRLAREAHELRADKADRSALAAACAVRQSAPSDCRRRRTPDRPNARRPCYPCASPAAAAHGDGNAAHRRAARAVQAGLQRP